MDKKTIQKSFGENLRKYRNMSGKSQEELAFSAEISTVHLGALERGEKCPTIETLLKLCTAMRISPTRLLELGDYEYESSEAVFIINRALKDIPDKDKVQLALVFEQLVKVYQRDF
ncbi:MAG: helix-turn-helix domain-containing protein [Oscillospiraceae bacterium]|nr:helix-turn-helix domain-containing protein [Oscillospiraceae bacterium]